MTLSLGWVWFMLALRWNYYRLAPQRVKPLCEAERTPKYESRMTV
jgi:hypothetical protein